VKISDPFRGRVAVVTGGAGGIGFAMAEAFAARGAKIALADLDEAAMDTRAKLLREREFTGQFHEGEHTSVHISVVAQRVILVILFVDRSSLGLVRLRVRKAGDELTRIFDAMMA